MANYDIVKSTKSVINRLLNNLPVGVPLDRVKLPNLTFNDKINDQIWIRPTIITVDSTQLPGRWKKDEKILVVDIFAPLGSGDLASLEIADKIRLLYENITFEDVNFLKAEILMLGSDGDYNQTQINIDFYYEGF